MILKGLTTAGEHCAWRCQSLPDRKYIHPLLLAPCSLLPAPRSLPHLELRKMILSDLLTVFTVSAFRPCMLSERQYIATDVV